MLCVPGATTQRAASERVAVNVHGRGQVLFVPSFPPMRMPVAYVSLFLSPWYKYFFCPSPELFPGAEPLYFIGERFLGRAVQRGASKHVAPRMLRRFWAGWDDTWCPSPRACSARHVFF